MGALRSLKGKTSKRARENTRKQLIAQISFMEQNLADKRMQLDRIKRYAKYNLPGYTRMKQRLEAGVRTAERDLEKLVQRYEKYERWGYI